MTLEQLRVFVAVAERQHVTQAAQALNVAQSAVSHAIATLEAQHAARLFDRVGRNIVLTEAGRIFLDEARAVLARADAAELMLNELGGLKRGTLTVQASQTIASYWLPRHLAAFRRAHPQIGVRLGIGNSAQVVSAVEQRLVEIGFVEGPVENEHLTSAPVARDQLVIVVAPDHPWAEAEALTPADLAAGAWLSREAGSGTRAVFEDAMTKCGLAPSALNIALELPSNEAVRGAAEAGLGAAALSASVAAPSIEAGLLRVAAFRLPERAFHAVRHRERAHCPVADALLAIIARSQRPA